MSGNICRCGAYPNIVAAIQSAPARRADVRALPVRSRRRRLRSAARRRRAAEAAFLAGGTTLVDLMRLGVMRRLPLVDVNHLTARAAIEEIAGGVCASARWRATATSPHHPLVRKRFPALAEALLAGASPQLRNMATVGGNLLQRTRCPYFRDVAVAECNKRQPGSGCAARWTGWTRMHAVLGGSARCIAAHPSDMCVALLALDAVVHTRRPRRATRLPIAELHTLPGRAPGDRDVARARASSSRT